MTIDTPWNNPYHSDRKEREELAAKEAETLVPWGSAHPMALPQQMLARVKGAIDAGREVSIIACVIEKNRSGNYIYTCTSSEMKSETALMAAHEIKQHVLKFMEHE